MVRVVLLPFHTTAPPAIQLEGMVRDATDLELDDAMSKAHMAAALVIKLGNDLKVSSQEQQTIIQRVRKVMPEASIRVQRSYSWLILATIKVCILKKYEARRLFKFQCLYAGIKISSHKKWSP